MSRIGTFNRRRLSNVGPVRRRRLAEQGLVVEQAADIMKNPYVLEFLELEARSLSSEHELETAIIDKLETLLL